MPKHKQVSLIMEERQCCSNSYKAGKQNVKNYRPVSLLPIHGKIFERLIYNVMYDFLTENDLLSPNQSGFRLGDSWINQLLSINYEILNAFDKGL